MAEDTSITSWPEKGRPWRETMRRIAATWINAPAREENSAGLAVLDALQTMQQYLAEQRPRLPEKQHSLFKEDYLILQNAVERRLDSLPRQKGVSPVVVMEGEKGDELAYEVAKADRERQRDCIKCLKDAIAGAVQFDKGPKKARKVKDIVGHGPQPGTAKHVKDSNPQEPSKGWDFLKKNDKPLGRG